MPTMLNVKESLQVSYLGAFISTGKRQIGVPFLIKNITDNILNVEIRPASSEEWITTTIYPGWNPEICIGVNISDETIQAAIQYGY